MLHSECTPARSAAWTIRIASAGFSSMTTRPISTSSFNHGDDQPTMWLNFLGSGGDGLLGEPPLQHALRQAAGPQAGGGEPAGRVVGEDAVGAPAVRHDLDVGGQLRQATG